MTIFAPIDHALSVARDRNTRIAFWWRDDDAVAPSPALDRLLALSARYRNPLALAVIPGGLEPELVSFLAPHADVSVLVHGFTHENHAPPGQKKAEFGPHRPLGVMAAEAEQALVKLRAAFPDRLVPVFVPPWNRAAPDLPPALAGLGYRGLSTFGLRKSREAAPGLRQVNTHIDPIDWHNGRGLVETDALIERIAEFITMRAHGQSDEVFGLLTHHLTHDEAIWAFCEGLFERLARSGIAGIEDIRRFE